jgi:hypothetical protein
MPPRASATYLRTCVIKHLNPEIDKMSRRKISPNSTQVTLPNPNDRVYSAKIAR